MGCVEVTLPPDCELWPCWVKIIQDLDGETVSPIRRDSDGDYLLPIYDTQVWVKGAWCKNVTECQWLPWDPSLPKGDYLITGGTWTHSDFGDMVMDFTALCHWNGTVFVSDDTEDTYFPTYYLANIPEVPK